MILPPRVVVVLNHASKLKVFGPGIGFCLATNPPLPSNVGALLASPLMAPVAPRATPEGTAPSLKPTEAIAVAPEDSPSRQ